MRLSVSKTVDSVAVNVVASSWGSLSIRRFCCVAMNAGLGFIPGARDELNVLGAVGGVMAADMHTDRCVLLLIGCGHCWKRSMLP